MLKVLVFRILASVSLLAAGTCAAGAQAFEDVAYLLQVTAAENAQIEISKVAADRATDPVIRDFAEQLADQYRRQLKRMSELAQAQGVEPVTVLDPATEEVLAKLKGLEGPAFDVYFVAAVAPAIYSEWWMHARTARLSPHSQIREVAAAQIGDLKARWDRALRLASRREKNLPKGLLHPNDFTVLIFGMNVDLAQIAFGKAALEKLEDKEIRAFAQRMIDEHTASYEAFAAMAREHGLTPLEAPGPFEQSLLQQLGALPPDAFARAYVGAQIIFHDNWYKRIEYTGHNGRDAQIKAYALAAHKVGMDHHDAILSIAREMDY